MIRWLNEEERDPIALPLAAEATQRGENVDALIAWCASERPGLRQRLLRHGALLFRGFAPATTGQFETFVRLFSAQGLRDYAGGASNRKHVDGHVYTSTETAAHYAISQHHEGAYLRAMPAVIGFICVTAAETGGETPLADSRRVLGRLEPDLVARFASGVRYTNNLPNGFGIGKSWQAQFETNDRAAVEERLRADGYEFAWKSDGGLRTSLAAPATITHAETGEVSWINQADHWHPSGLAATVRARMAQALPETDFPMHASLADGTALEEDDLGKIRAAIAAEKRMFTWQEGDMLVCDNLLVSHGRQPFTGARRVLVALG